MAVEYYTGWPIARAVAKADTVSTVKSLYEDIFMVIGPPSKLLSDNGLHFVNKAVDDFVKFVNVRHQFSTPYKSSTNGKVEKLNGSIVRGIKKIVGNNPGQWDTLLYTMMYAYRTKTHKSMGISPYEALYGAPPRNYLMDPLHKLGMKLGLERLYLLMDRRLSHEEKELAIYKEESPKGEIPIGSQVIMVKIFLKKISWIRTIKTKFILLWVNFIIILTSASMTKA